MPITRALPKSLAALVALAALAACADTPTAGPPDPRQAAGEPVAETDTVSPPPDTIIYEGEQEYEDIAREVPGYAGHWYDEEGNRVVALTDLSQQDLALQVISSRPEPEPAEGEPRTGVTLFVQADYDFPTLRDYRNSAAFPVLGVEGAAFVDLDEVRNRVMVGLVDESARAGVEEQLQASGVPPEAAIVEVTGAPESFQTLQNFFRPLRSGYQIQNHLGGLCTLGVPSLAAWPSYITNSHCTQVYWFNTGTNIFQHAVGGGLFIGTEVSDPPGWPCGGGWLCRWSDAARIQVAGGVPAANQIARTQFPGIHWAPGSLVTAGIAPFNVVNPPQMYPFPGQWVDKVGRTTGWTRGIVTHTCINLAAGPPAPPGRLVLCQYLATNMAGPGDSGSPVFLNLGANARVTGLLWGGIVLPGFARMIFSPRGGVVRDLGA